MGQQPFFSSFLTVDFEYSWANSVLYWFSNQNVVLFRKWEMCSQSLAIPTTRVQFLWIVKTCMKGVLIYQVSASILLSSICWPESASLVSKIWGSYSPNITWFQDVCYWVRFACLRQQVWCQKYEGSIALMLPGFRIYATEPTCWPETASLVPKIWIFYIPNIITRFEDLCH